MVVVVVVVCSSSKVAGHGVTMMRGVSAGWEHSNPVLALTLAFVVDKTGPASDAQDCARLRSLEVRKRTCEEVHRRHTPRPWRARPNYDCAV